MSNWKVTEILNGNTIRVARQWKWEGKSGYDVYINGYSETSSVLPLEMSKALAKKRLENLLLDKEIVLTTPAKLDEHGILHCNVLLNNVNVSNYFPDFQLKK